MPKSIWNGRHQYGCEDESDGPDVPAHRCGSTRPMSEACATVRDDDLDLYGEAISVVVWIDKIHAAVATNDEYATIIGFCPFCGIELTPPT